VTSSQSPAEVCAECGFDGSTWTDVGALSAIAELPGQWSQAVEHLSRSDLQRRPIPSMWSMVEYVDHVREVLFGMRFLLDTALSDPGTALGDVPEPRFDFEPRAIDPAGALAGLSAEVEQLRNALAATPLHVWASTAIVGGEEHDLHWIARHAVHDATHHLRDVERLRAAL
jgi:DinB superfamily